MKDKSDLPKDSFNEPASNKKFDASIRKAIKATHRPEGLKELILDQCIPSEVSSTQSSVFQWVRYAIAACIVILFMVGFSLYNRLTNDEPLATLEFRSAMASYAYEAKFFLDLNTAEIDEISDWLVERKWPKFEKLPQSLGANQVLGCKKLTWRGQEVSLVCFHRADRKLVHLFVMPRSTSSGDFVDVGELAVVYELETGGWADEQNLYLLVGSEPGVTVGEYLEDSSFAALINRLDFNRYL